MFLKIFQAILAALNKNVRMTLWAVTISVLIFWGLAGEFRLKKKDEQCQDERRSDKATISAQAEELKATRERLLDFALGQREIERKAHENDSVIREATKPDINKVMP